ncbi:MAG: phosphoenolpyruvate carboxykinase (ATP) [Candidatus Micrarchaeota archaeon]
MSSLFSDIARDIFLKAETEGHLSSDINAITEGAAHDRTTCSARGTCDVLTEYGSHAYISKITSRSASQTKVFFGEPDAETKEIALAVARYLSEKGIELVWIDRTMGMHPAHSTHCRTVVTKPYVRLLNMWDRLLFHAERRDYGKHDQILIQVPEWETVAPKYLPGWCEKQKSKGKPLRRIFVDANAKVTFVLGSDYFGEVKKGHLRMAMYGEKNRYNKSKGREGGLGVHAGGKVIRTKNAKTGETRDFGALFFGLSGTGKTSLSVHHFWMDGEGERVIIRQDDFFVLDAAGKAYGTEDNAYIKTEGLEAEGQPLLYQGAIEKNTLLENVFVDPKTRKVDFFKYDHPFTPNGKCLNGRGIVVRSELVANGVKQADENIDLESVDMIFFITRRDTIVPPVASLSVEQAVAFFMLGESIITSAADPVRAGQSVREVGTNPFIVGSKDEEGNIFYELCKSNPRMRCYLLNTGSFGGRTTELGRDTLDENWAEESAERFSKGIEHQRVGESITLSVNGKDITYRIALVKTKATYRGKEIVDPKKIGELLKKAKLGEISKRDVAVYEDAMLEADKISVKDSCTIIREIARGTVEWCDDSEWHYEVAKDVPGLDMGRFDWKKYYSEEEFHSMTEALRKERVEWLGMFGGLRKEIQDVIG